MSRLSDKPVSTRSSCCLGCCCRFTCVSAELAIRSCCAPAANPGSIGDDGNGMVLNSDRDHVIATLRAHERELKGFGIVRLRLFGSIARGEAGNDVDLVAEFDRALSLIDLVGLENRLSDLLGRPVDLAQERMLKPRVRANVDREALLAF